MSSQSSFDVSRNTAVSFDQNSESVDCMIVGAPVLHFMSRDETFLDEELVRRWREERSRLKDDLKECTSALRDLFDLEENDQVRLQGKRLALLLFSLRPYTVNYELKPSSEDRMVLGDMCRVFYDVASILMDDYLCKKIDADVCLRRCEIVVEKCVTGWRNDPAMLTAFVVASSCTNLQLGSNSVLYSKISNDDTRKLCEYVARWKRKKENDVASRF